MPDRIAGLVSVIVPCYQQRHFIVDAVTSVLAQTYAELEVVVTDDGSTDGSQEAIAELARRDPRVVPVLSGVNTGIAGNLNRGLARCRGEYLAHLDGDDLWLPRYLERQVGHLRDRPELTESMTDIEVFDSSSGSAMWRWSDRFALREGGPDLELGAPFFARGPATKSLPSAVLRRRRVVPAHGWDERLRWANDWLLGIESLAAPGARRGVVQEVLVRYRRHPENISAAASTQGSFEEMLIVLAIVETRIPELGDRVRRTRAYLLAEAAAGTWDADWGAPERVAARKRQADGQGWHARLFVGYRLLRRGLGALRRAAAGRVRSAVGGGK